MNNLDRGWNHPTIHLIWISLISLEHNDDEKVMAEGSKDYGE
jgi:hypothetical protein